MAPRTRVLSGILAICLLIGVIVFRFRRGEEGVTQPADPAKFPNIVLFTLDTLRAQNVHCYGYERETTPQIDALAAASNLYTRAYATSPWTLPSHASLFTGEFPTEHGARSYRLNCDAEGTTEGGKVYHNPLDDSAWTLAEALQQEGYRTVGITANVGFLSPESHLDQGFDAYFNGSYPAETLNENVWKWLKDHPERPFFMFINYMDMHQPYNTVPIPGFLDDMKSTDSAAVLTEVRQAALTGTRPIPEDKIKTLLDQYDLGIRHADRAVGAVVAKLKEMGIYDSTMVIVTSDHGEFFGEHDLFGHSVELYEEVLKIPLVVKLPQQKSGARREELISLVDIPNIIFQAMPEEGGGRNLKKFARRPGNHPVLAEVSYNSNPVFDETPLQYRFARERVCFYRWPLKYIQSSDGKNELYNLETDPAEVKNLVEAGDSSAGAMDGALRSYLESLKIHPSPGAGAAGPSQKQLDALKKLGYLGR
ncbi:sulfatase [Candidatus Sumerlaeota bacterium]|nr:sulfatase [Candidatus Sumerlaeota bacterium]